MRDTHRQWHPYEIVIIDYKKRTIDYTKVVVIFGDPNDNDYINDDSYEIVITISNRKNKALNKTKTSNY
jgi:hypothetical protein